MNAEKGLPTEKIGTERISTLKALVAEVRQKIKDEGGAINQLAKETGLSPDEVLALMPFEKKELRAEQALVRRAVSRVMFEGDKTLSPHEQQAIIDRQIQRYFNYQLHPENANCNLRGHVEAVHGTKPPDYEVEKSKAIGAVSFEEGTNEMAQATERWMTAENPRTTTDTNRLNESEKDSVRIEGKGVAKEYNSNAVKAQRDLTRKMLEDAGNLDENGKAINPYLSIHLHRKVDTRGANFEIGAAPKIGDKKPLDPRVAFWFAEQLRGKIESRELKREDGEFLTVNVACSNHVPYSGSPALSRLRYGDDVFDFKGFGESLQALQLECSIYTQQNHGAQVSEMLSEILAEFTEKFKTMEDLEDLEKGDQYLKEYQSKQKKDYEALFERKNIRFGRDCSGIEVPEGSILIAPNLMKALNLTMGAKVMVADHELTVELLDNKRTSTTVALPANFEEKIGEKIQIEPIPGESN